MVMFDLDAGHLVWFIYVNKWTTFSKIWFDNIVLELAAMMLM